MTTFETNKLANGMTIVYVPQKNTKSLTTLVMCPVGSRYEPDALQGVSHFIEHMMFKGTKKRKDTLTITKEIDRLGADYNAFTSKEYTGYYIKSDARYAEISFDILSDMLFDSVFDEKEMKKEKLVICEEIKMYNDNPLMNIGSLFEEALYTEPLGNDIAGTAKHVQSYTKKDVIAFRDRFYTPNNMTVVLAGAIDDTIRAHVEEYFGNKPVSTQDKQSYVPAAVRSAKTDTERIRIQKKETEQTQLILGFPAYAHEDENNAALSVLSTILGGSMSSRLFIKIREKMGLAYMIRSGRSKFIDTGYLSIQVGLDTKNMNAAIAAIKKELEQLKTAGVTDEELADAKTHMQGGLTLALEDTSYLANYFAKQALFHDEIKTPEEKLENVLAVTKDDVLRVANEVFAMESMRVAVIGDCTVDDIQL